MSVEIDLRIIFFACDVYTGEKFSIVQFLLAGVDNTGENYFKVSITYSEKLS
jgi:hypothetical protein